MANIKIKLTESPKLKPFDQTKLGFGKIFTDHMFMMNYDEGEGWHDPRIVPKAPIELDPAAMCLHYGQEVFEGLKAYPVEGGRILLFRADKNFERLNLSNRRLCIPEVDEDLCLEATKKLVEIDREWIPTEEGTSLYIRPFIIATDPFLGVHAGKHYLFMIVLSPVGAYYPTGLNPIRIYVEQNYVRAAKGGTGFAKTAGNYAATLKAQDDAEKIGYNQVLWLDSNEHKYVEEVGAMNMFFKIGGKVITPSLQGSILGGITRMSSIELIRSWGVEVEERPVSIDEVLEAADQGILEEAFGTGTAAVVSPVGELLAGDRKIIINDCKIGPLSQKLYDTLTGVQWGRIPDTLGWTIEVK